VEIARGGAADKELFGGGRCDGFRVACRTGSIDEDSGGLKGDVGIAGCVEGGCVGEAFDEAWVVVLDAYACVLEL
jgi:hypothetical protein